jgi:hypothetical protein
VLAWGDRTASRRSLYSGTGAPRLCRPLRCFAGVAALCCGLAAAACSFPLHHQSAKDNADVEQTGSIGRQDGRQDGRQEGRQGEGQADRQGTPPDEPPSRVTAQPSEADLVYAREVAAELLSRSGRDLSVPWENPNTGAGGNITPLANAYTEGGLPCRDFLASYVHGGAQDWLEGAACRTSRGTWEVKRLKPFNRV